MRETIADKRGIGKGVGGAAREQRYLPNRQKKRPPILDKGDRRILSKKSVIKSGGKYAIFRSRRVNSCTNGKERQHKVPEHRKHGINLRTLTLIEKGLLQWKKKEQGGGQGFATFHGPRRGKEAFRFRGQHSETRGSGKLSGRKKRLLRGAAERKRKPVEP